MLSGGGARGAYQAGVIEGLRRAAEVVDGQPLPGIGVVCGTSIGARFVATAQYTKLGELWHGVAAQHAARRDRHLTDVCLRSRRRRRSCDAWKMRSCAMPSEPTAIVSAFA